MRTLQSRAPERSPRGRGWGRVACGLGAGVCVLLGARTSHAQLGASNVPLPNVMLLLDTSGSFEKMIDGSNPEDPQNNPVTGTVSTFAMCNAGSPPPPGIPAGPTIPNRWGVEVQALTGSILPFYNCFAMDRTQAAFAAQYAITDGSGTHNPYDSGYYLPFHRPLSQTGPNSWCAYTPGALPGATGGGGVGGVFPPDLVGPARTSPTDCNGVACNADDFPSDAIGTYLFDTLNGAAPNNRTNPPSCTFNQLTNGALDSASTLMRFGLMTFDNDPQPGIGVNGTPNYRTADTPNGPFDGMWSYFAGWDTSPANAVQGWPSGCLTRPYYYELGARNPAAPPWEGRLVMFPDPNADTNEVVANNNNIQAAINAMRPYGATPIAAMLDDAEQYFWADSSGPQLTDSYVSGGCRPQFIILLTDGEPNMDMRPNCGGYTGTGGGGGQCPYDTAADIALKLYNGGNSPASDNYPTHPGRSGQSIKTFVIGFAVSQYPTGPYAQCSQLTGQLSGSGICANYPVMPPGDQQYAPCCALQQIAVAGGTNQAYFADTPGDLDAALGIVLGQIAKQLGTRSLPSFAPVQTFANGATAGTSSFFIGQFSGATAPWSGDILRETLTCTPQGNTFQVQVQNPPLPGFDYAYNTTLVNPSQRGFLAYSPPSAGGAAAATSTLRPYLQTPTDGLVAFGAGGSEWGLTGAVPTSINATNFPPPLMNITNTSCQDPLTRKYLSAADCTNVAIGWTAGQTSVSTGTPFTFVSRCPSPPAPGPGLQTAATCLPLGGILHSTPAISNTPSSPLRDDSYQSFAFAFTSLATPRNPVVYAASTDGMLHAFDTTVGINNGVTNNELWSFIPPGVFPNLLSNYPSGSSLLLDGAPVVRDVVWDRVNGSTCPNTVNAAQCWHSMLVGGYGGGGRGYYALDVTDPRSASYSQPSYSGAPTWSLTGPHFQWQLASMNIPGAPGGPQNEIFAKQSTTPAIATVFADITGQNQPAHEIGVAILPGGLDGPPLGDPTCPRAVGNNANFPKATYDLANGTTFQARPNVRRWTKNCGDALPGRSVTIARVDTGQIIAVFTRGASFPTPDAPNNLLNSANPKVVIDSPFDSPMTGTPVVYPADLGSIAQRVFIGDADGTLWRLDLSSTDPTKWTAQIFLDTYSADQQFTVNDPVYDAQPIEVPPIVSLDPTGNVTVAVATGTLGTFNAVYTKPGLTPRPRVPLPTYTAVNYVYSAVEVPNLPGPPAVTTKVNYFVEFKNGERVSGPMAVFNNLLYFMTFAPAQAGLQCSGGDPRIWAMDYIKPNSGSCPSDTNVICPTGIGQGGDTTNSPVPSGSLADPPDANGNSTKGLVIPGLSVAFAPACVGAGAQTPAAPMLSVNIGTVGSGGGQMKGFGLGGQVTGGANGAPPFLPPPRGATSVDSWAALTE